MSAILTIREQQTECIRNLTLALTIEQQEIEQLQAQANDQLELIRSLGEQIELLHEMFHQLSGAVQAPSRSQVRPTAVAGSSLTASPAIARTCPIHCSAIHPDCSYCCDAALLDAVAAGGVA